MELYHVSCKDYENGTVLYSSDFEETEYYLNSKAQNKNWIDETLDKNRPDGFPERKKSLFAFDNLGNCFAFKKGECHNRLNFYKVEMNNPKACPMCLTDALKQSNNELNKAVSREYWEPKQNWRFLEYLSTEMKIIERVSEPDIMTKAAGQNNYQCDFEQKKKIKY